MGVDHHAFRLAERHTEYDIGRLPCDSGQFQELVHFLRNFAGMIFRNNPARALDAPRFVAKEAC
jgi:hypothetical protein